MGWEAVSSTANPGAEPPSLCGAVPGFHSVLLITHGSQPSFPKHRLMPWWKVKGKLLQARLLLVDDAIEADTHGFKTQKALAFCVGFRRGNLTGSHRRIEEVVYGGRQGTG